MLSPESFLQVLKHSDISFFAGVPDSLLKDFCACVSKLQTPETHVVCANEGSAIGMGIGYHLATGKVPLIYLQNSGLGNTINPILSLADEQAYAIPMLLLIGWRGEPNVPDEPQHIKQGKEMLPMLDIMGIQYDFLGPELDIPHIVKSTLQSNKPHALIVRKKVFSSYQANYPIHEKLTMSRESAIKHILKNLKADDIVVSTTGMTSREVFEHREEQNDTHARDFLTIGGMGHASQIAIGIALQTRNRQVLCLDGDGAAIMHLGSWSNISTLKCQNFKHILLNNGAHDSVGGQPTAAFDIDFQKIGLAMGYRHVERVSTLPELNLAMKRLMNAKGPILLEVQVKTGARKDLGRPTTTPIENKTEFMNFLQASRSPCCI